MQEDEGTCMYLGVTGSRDVGRNEGGFREDPMRIHCA